MDCLSPKSRHIKSLIRHFVSALGTEGVKVLQRKPDITYCSTRIGPEQLNRRALEMVLDGTLGINSHLSLVEKATCGQKPVIDLSTLNSFVCLIKFNMDTVPSDFPSIMRGDLLVFIDLKEVWCIVVPKMFARSFVAVVVWGCARGI